MQEELRELKATPMETATPPRFQLGRVMMTYGVRVQFCGEDLEGEPAAVGRNELFLLVVRHARGDWGDHLDQEDKDANERALQEGTRLLSAYTLRDVKVWVITEWDRSATTILLPEEY